MSEVKIMLSEGFFRRNMAPLRAELSAYVACSEPQYIVRRSAEPVAQFIQLVADLPAWAPLVPPATVFSTSYAARLGSRFADWTADRVLSRGQRNDSKSIADLAHTVTSYASLIQGPVEFRVGLAVPDFYFGTVFTVDAKNEADILRTLNLFLMHAAEIDQVVKRHIADGQGPITGARVKYDDEGTIIVTWNSQEDWKERSFRIPRDIRNDMHEKDI